MKSLLLQEGQLKFNLNMPLRKSFQITEEQPEMPEEFASLQLEQGYYFWGYANVSSVDIQGDMFPIETLKQMAPNLTKAPYNKIFLNHDYNDIASGQIVATAVDEKGLLILAKLNDEHMRASEVWASIMNGSLDGLSMGGSFLQVDTIEDESSGMSFNVIREAVATEVSLTSIPANGNSLLQGAFKKAKDIFNKVEDKEFNKSLKIESKGEDKKFFINQEFLKSMKADKQEKYIKNQKPNTNMEKKEELNAKQKEVFDKAISEGKNEDEAMKIASALLDKEAIEGAESKSDDLAKNPEKTGAENEATKKKELKKSLEEPESTETEETDKGTDEKTEESNSEEEIETVEANTEEGDNAETSEDATPEEKIESDEDKESPTEESEEDDSKSEEEVTEETEETEEEEEKVDYKQEYEKSLKTIAQLESELSTFKKSLPGKEDDTPEKKPMRKSVKTEQSAEVKVDNTESPKSKTPFIEWMKRV